MKPKNLPCHTLHILGCYTPCMRSVLALLLVAVSPRLTTAQSLEERVWIGVGIEVGEVGVLVTDVVEDAPAHAAGLLPGDEILAVDRIRVAEPVGLQRLVAGHHAGDEVELHVLRDRRHFRTRVELQLMPARDEILRRRLVDKPVPALEVEVLCGSIPGELAKLRGKVVLLHLFSTHCPSCQASHASLSDLASTRARDGLVVLAISGQPAETLEQLIKSERPAFAVARDPDGAAARSLYADRLPVFVVVDRRGIVRFAAASADPVRESGLSRQQAIEANLAAAVFAAERLLGSKQ